jgi:CO/xanthine dehydrogenase FAD-binding subunit
MRGERALLAEEFFSSYFTTAREPDELVVAVRIPVSAGRVAFHEVTPRLGGSTGEFATVAVAATADLEDDGRFSRVSLAYAGVAERAIRAREAEALLAGAEATPEAIATAADRAAEAVEPPVDIHAGPEYRRRLVRVLTRRALEELAAP